MVVAAAALNKDITIKVIQFIIINAIKTPSFVNIERPRLTNETLFPK